MPLFPSSTSHSPIHASIHPTWLGTVQDTGDIEMTLWNSSFSSPLSNDSEKSAN